MVVGRLIGIAAALSLLGVTGAGAETIYLNGQTYVAAPPGSIVITPAPIAEPRYVVTESAVAIAPQSYVVVSPPTTSVAPQTTYVAPTYVTPRYRVQAASPYDAYASGVLDAAYVEPRCAINSFGFERCY